MRLDPITLKLVIQVKVDLKRSNRIPKNLYFFQFVKDAVRQYAQQDLRLGQKPRATGYVWRP